MNEEINEHNKAKRKKRNLKRLIEQEEEIEVDWGKNGYEAGDNLVYRGTLLKKSSKELKHMAMKMDENSVEYSIIALILQRRHWGRKPIQ